MSATETADEIARLNRECEAHIARIAELEAECREWKEQCEQGDAKLVRECLAEEWREQCRGLEKRLSGSDTQIQLERSVRRLLPIEKAADVLAEAVDRMPQKTMAVHDALFSYLKVKESK